MIATTTLLVKPAEQAGIKIPGDPTLWNEKDPRYLRWTVFCNAQIGRSLPHPTAHWDNALVISRIPENELKELTMEQLVAKGFQLGTTIP